MFDSVEQYQSQLSQPQFNMEADRSFKQQNSPCEVRKAGVNQLEINDEYFDLNDFKSFEDDARDYTNNPVSPSFTPEGSYRGPIKITFDCSSDEESEPNQAIEGCQLASLDQIFDFQPNENKKAETGKVHPNMPEIKPLNVAALNNSPELKLPKLSDQNLGNQIKVPYESPKVQISGQANFSSGFSYHPLPSPDLLSMLPKEKSTKHSSMDSNDQCETQHKSTISGMSVVNCDLYQTETYRPVFSTALPKCPAKTRTKLADISNEADTNFALRRDVINKTVLRMVRRYFTQIFKKTYPKMFRSKKPKPSWYFIHIKDL